MGYGAASDACVRLARDLGAACVAGNHDLVVLGELGFERCASRPAFSLRRTRERLSVEARLELGRWPLELDLGGGLVAFHGALGDPTRYLTTSARVAETHERVVRRYPRARVCFFGHTHARAVYEAAGGAVVAGCAAGCVRLAPGRTYYVNPGAVDASRKPGEKRAEMAIFDDERGELEFFSAPYDHERAERAAEAAGYRMRRRDELVYRAAHLLRRGHAAIACAARAR